MKLSEAILKGCVNTNKIKMCLVDQNHLGVGCCVMGALAIGLGCELNQEKIRAFLDDLWDRGEITTKLWQEMNRRNDHTDETRESIASWLWSLGR